MTTTASPLKTRAQAAPVRASSSRGSRGISAFLTYLSHGAIWLYVLLLLVPIYYLVISAFKTNTAILNEPFNPFAGLVLDNFGKAWEQATLGPALLNQAYLTVGASVLTLLLAIPASYALARSKGKLGSIVERIFQVGFLVPAFAALVPTVMLAISMNLFHTREFLILFLPAGAMPLSVILLTQAMRTVPAELEESAVLDGASQMRVLWAVFLPVTMPTTITVIILNFLGFWNEYFFSLVIIGPDPALRTAQVALPTLSMTNAAQYGVLAAGIVITLIPVYIVYAIFAEKMEGAVLAGALKG
ncbi:carbohydrate ABC transporter permease [Mycetocola sp. JXN-3]|uniref:carbohydrate ABC transporter permease n=1 Tax=Mycetocola sp. JXN-3 TaxID=2116510 RepID=UPI00165CF0CE|nr:carbohydrate ABC transporter permease [Mycetocola sp. JXN-3]